MTQPYLSIVMAVLFAPLMASAPQPLPQPENTGHTPTLHLIMIADTRDPGIGSESMKAQLIIQDEFSKNASNSSLSYNAISIIDEGCTAFELKKRIGNMEVAPCDVIVFASSVHGVNDGSDWPKLYLIGGEIRLWDIRNLLKAKNPRLLLMFNQSCNGAPGIMAEKCEYKTASPAHIAGRNKAYTQDLFRKYEGELIFSASQKGSYAFLNMKGGFFLHEVVKELQRQTQSVNPSDHKPDWDSFIKNVKLNTAREAAANGCPQTPINYVSLKRNDEPCKSTSTFASYNHHLAGDMVAIVGGTYNMGCTAEQQDCDSDEKPVTGMTLGNFYMGKYEVTFDQYDRFCDATGRPKPADKEDWAGPTHQIRMTDSRY